MYTNDLNYNIFKIINAHNYDQNKMGKKKKKNTLYIERINQENIIEKKKVQIYQPEFSLRVIKQTETTNL